MDPLGPYLAGYGALFGNGDLTAYEVATGASRAYRVGPTGGYTPSPASSQGDYFDPHTPAVDSTADAAMASRLDAQLALLEAQGVYVGFGVDAFGAPSWMPGAIAPYWDRAATVLSRIGPNTEAGWSYMVRLNPIGLGWSVVQAQLDVIADAGTKSAAWATNKVRNKSRELAQVFEQYQTTKATFDARIEELAKTDPVKAEVLRGETYGAMQGPKSAFLQATSKFAQAADSMSQKTQGIIRQLRAESGLTPIHMSGHSRLGDAGVISIPTATAIGGAVIALIVVGASIYLIKTLITDLTIGVQQADQSLFEQERQRGIDSGLDEEQAVERALEITNQMREGRLDLNSALPWIFGIVGVGVGLPLIYKTVKDIRG